MVKGSVLSRESRVRQPYHIPRNQFPSKRISLLSIAHNCSPHRDIGFETCNHICRLLLLIPANGGIQTQNPNNDTKVNPVLQPGSKQDSKFHNYNIISTENAKKEKILISP